MRIFLDANVLFSAAKSDGAVRRLVRIILDNGHECWIDGFVLAEARRNLEVKAPEGIEALDRLLPRLTMGETRPRPKVIGDLPLPPKDRPVLAAAIVHRCDALVTGGRTHSGKLYGKTIRGVAIHSPRSLAEALLV